MNIMTKITCFIIILFSIFYSFSKAAIVSDYSFESGLVPTQWTTTPTSQLIVGTDHIMDGTKGVVWSVTPNSVLTINMGGTNSTTTPIVFLPIYSTLQNSDTLYIKMYNSTKTVLLRQTKMVLKYKGWREFHRQFYKDYGLSPISGNFQYLEITFKPVTGSTRTKIWFDNAHLSVAETGEHQIRYPGPYYDSDYQNGYFNNVTNVNTSLLMPFMATIPSVTITAGHRTSFSAVASQFSYSVLGGSTTSTAADIASAKDTVKAYAIFSNPDGSLKGKSISRTALYNSTFLKNYSVTILNLANAALANTPDNAAKDSLIKFTRYLLDRGLAEGGISTISGDYDYIRKYLWMGWTRAMTLYQAYDNANPGSTLAAEVAGYLRYTYQYGYIYRTTVDDVYGDFIFTNARILFIIATLRPTTDEKIRDYICGVDFYNKFSGPKIGGLVSGIKIDGVYFHHGSMHNSYSYALDQWVADMNKMNNTPFSISTDAYWNMAKALKTKLLECATNSTISSGEAFYANTLCGRAPFGLNSLGTISSFKTLINMGGSLTGQTFEPTMAANYNYFFPNYNPFPVPATDLSGYYSFNYGQLGIYRGSQSWVATMRGFTSKLWGTEIYTGANMFGRYQSYGVLEVMYRATDILATSGYPSSPSIGYDWNVVAGATVVHHSPNYWFSIQPCYGNGRLDEKQKNDFAGALTLGKGGVFAMNFIENPAAYIGTGPRFNVPDNMKFKKSVFAHNNLLVCLGSDITFFPGTGRSADSLATNLFQHVFTGTRTAMYLNNSTPVTTDLTTTIQLSGKSYWGISPATTGYFIPQQSGVLHIKSGVQSTPPYNVGASTYEVDYASLMLTSTAAKAWITHPSTSSNSYEFVVIPGTKPSAMAALSSTLGNGKGVYDILQRDSMAHVVRFNDDNTVGYAVFKASTLLPAPLISADNACLIMTQSNNNTFNININSPDLNCKTNAAALWISAPKIITVRMNGLWNASGNLPTNVLLLLEATTTKIQATVQDGLPVNLVLTKATTVTDTKTLQTISCYASDRIIYLSGVADNTIINIYNSLGQVITNLKAKIGINIITVKAAGIYLVKAGTFSQKIYLN